VFDQLSKTYYVILHITFAYDLISNSLRRNNRVIMNPAPDFDSLYST